MSTNSGFPHSSFAHSSFVISATLQLSTLEPQPPPMDWPVATVLLGTLGTLAVGLLKWVPRRGEGRGEVIGNGRVYAHATDLAEIRARLVSLEQAHHVLRAEIRADIRELQTTIRELLNQG
jgi:hypothetical protein